MPTETARTVVTVVTGSSGIEGFRGRKVESIIRREYGRGAFVWWSSDPSAPHVGTVVVEGRHGGYAVLDRVLRVEGGVE
jgi:hypothetical protein